MKTVSFQAYSTPVLILRVVVRMNRIHLRGPPLFCLHHVGRETNPENQREIRFIEFHIRVNEVSIVPSDMQNLEIVAPLQSSSRSY